MTHRLTIWWSWNIGWQRRGHDISVDQCRGQPRCRGHDTSVGNVLNDTSVDNVVVMTHRLIMSWSWHIGWQCRGHDTSVDNVVVMTHRLTMSWSWHIGWQCRGHDTSVDNVVVMTHRLIMSWSCIIYSGSAIISDNHTNAIENKCLYCLLRPRRNNFVCAMSCSKSVCVCPAVNLSAQCLAVNLPA